jgi:hypothetical protein
MGREERQLPFSQTATALSAKAQRRQNSRWQCAFAICRLPNNTHAYRPVVTEFSGGSWRTVASWRRGVTQLPFKPFFAPAVRSHSNTAT